MAGLKRAPTVTSSLLVAAVLLLAAVPTASDYAVLPAYPAHVQHRARYNACQQPVAKLKCFLLMPHAITGSCWSCV